MIEGLGLAFGVAMDAAAIAGARALGRDSRAIDGIVLALVFGAFQAAMALVGFGLAHVGAEWFAAIDHWIAAGTLVAIGIKMLRDAWRDRHPKQSPTSTADSSPSLSTPLSSASRPRTTSGLRWRDTLILGVATSIDAAAVGMSLPLVKVDPWLAIALMGLVTFACTAIAHATARAIGKRFGGGLEALGGLVLIVIGVRVLVEHL